jgi:hypothetical protein
LVDIVIHVTEATCVVPISVDAVTIRVMPRIEGRKKFIAGGLKMEATKHNLRLFEELGAKVIDDRPILRPPEASAVDYRPQMPRMPHQETSFAQGMALPVFADYSDPGTGKSKTFIDMVGTRYSQGLITGVLLFSPKGVHRQWIEEQFPTHIDPRIKWHGVWWRKRQDRIDAALEPRSGLDVLSMNIDALDTDKGFEVAQLFAQKHPGRLYIGIDESQDIRNVNTNRSKLALSIRDLARFRHIMSGTPAPKGLENIWGQFMWLDPNIIGIEYVTTFRREFCIMGGFKNNEVVGYRDLEKFNRLTGPYIFRVTQQDIGRAPPVYSRWRFDMAPSQKEVYTELKTNLIVELKEIEEELGKWKLKHPDDPTPESVVLQTREVGVKLLRLQQITCGFIGETIKGAEGARDTKIIREFPDNPRRDELELLLNNKPGKAAIWCRFHYDVETVLKLFPDRALDYYGKTKSDDRERHKKAWLDPDSKYDYLVLTAETGGVGLNLQGSCLRNVYYSNTYNAEDRWQSEKRIDRIGATGIIENIDMVCKGSTDLAILANLKEKRDVQDLGVTGLRQLLESEI